MTRRFETGPAPHFAPRSTVAGVMRQVIYALLPALLAQAWFFGPGVLLQAVLAILFALGFEASMLGLRGRPLRPFIGDGSAVVTALLFAVCVPPLAPWWVAAVGMFFAIVVAKHLFGGLGHNLFNPAMVGYVAVLISFPVSMTAWLPPVAATGLAPDAGQAAAAILAGQLPADGSWDALTAATPLDRLRTAVASGQSLAEVRQAPVFGQLGGLGWEWIACWYALGGLWLLWRGIIAWHVPAAMLSTVAVLASVAWVLDPAHSPTPAEQLLSGAAMIGAFFIATDPVSGCASPRGRLLFGVGVGLVTVVIRRWGAYPDGVAFAVLVMNAFAPLIDRYTRPRIYGHGGNPR